MIQSFQDSNRKFQRARKSEYCSEAWRASLEAGSTKPISEDFSGMQMGADPNLNYGVFPQSFCNQRVVSFQTGAVTSGSGVMPVCIDNTSEMNGNAGMLNNAPSMIMSTSSPTTIADTGQNLKYGTPMAVDWSPLELQVLKNGLEKYANEPGIMKYIKIAAALPDKTVRDVAMRCQWMAKKENTRRAKPQEYYIGKKIRDRKEKMALSSLWLSNHPVQPEMRASSSFMVQNTSHDNRFLSGASEIDSAMSHLLEENARLLNQIEANILTSQTRNNVNLFHRIRMNINDLLQSMSRMPGIMSKMPPLPVSVDEKLSSYLLPGVTMAQVLGSSHLKEEPRGW